MSNEFTLKGVKEEAQNRVKREIKAINFFTYISMFICLATSIVNYFTIKIDLHEAYLVILPLMVYAFYNMFYNTEIEYGVYEKIILLLTILFYLIGLMIRIFTSFPFLVLFLNFVTLILFLLIVKTIVWHMYLRLLAYSLDSIDKRISEFTLIITQNKHKNENYQKKFYSDVYKCLCRLEYWHIISPSYMKKQKTPTIFMLISNIILFVIRVNKTEEISTNSEIGVVLDLVELFENRYLDKALSDFSTRNIMSALRYHVIKIDSFYAEKMFVKCKSEIDRYLYEVLEKVIQQGRTYEFDKGISLLMSLVDDFTKVDIKSEQLKISVDTVYSSIFLLRKYLDNINSISGKFILQLISKKYKMLSSNQYDEELNYHLFQLVELLKSKDDEKSTMKIYYHFLSDVMNTFKDIDSKILFLKDIIWAFGDYEEEISMFVFADLKTIFKDYTDKDIVLLSSISIHNSFKSNVLNRHSDMIVEYIVKNINSSREDEIISSLAYLLTEKTNYGVYFFQEIIDSLESNQFSIYDFILESNHRLFKLEKEIMQNITLNDDIDSVLYHIFKLNKYIVSQNCHSDKKRELLKFYEYALNILEEYYNYANNNKRRIDSIEWVRSFAKTNLLNNNFKYSIQVLFNIGLRTLQSEDWEVLTSVSENFGWTLYNGIASDDVKIETINSAFEKLITFFKRSCIFSTEYVKRYIGTAIVINYIQARIKYSSIQNYQNIHSQIINLSLSNDKYKLMMKDSISLKDGLVDEFFKNEEYNASKYFLELQQIFS